MAEHDASDALVATARQLVANRPDLPDLEPAPVGRKALASMIDHTLLKAEATPSMVHQLCIEAAEHQFASVCVTSAHVARCASILAGTGVGVCSVTGFPLGNSLSDVKAVEARRAIDLGANEIDMVMQVGAHKATEYAQVHDDIAAVAAVCGPAKVKLKVILETCLLDDLEIAIACLLAVQAGADYVKTSTGMNVRGATLSDVALMRHVVGPQIGVKAAGGIRTYQEAIAMVAAGASRLGASAGVVILEGAGA